MRHPLRRHCVMKRLTPERFVDEMPADFVVYDGRAYVGLKNTAIEVWELGEPLRHSHNLEGIG